MRHADVTAEGGAALPRAASSAAHLRDQLGELIEHDGLRPGDRVPTETALAARLQVSRSKVREALKLLEQDGLVHAVQGSGRFVSALGTIRVERPVTVYESITELLAHRGHEVTTAVLGIEEADADDHVARALEISPGAPVIRLTRLRLGDGEPMVFSVNTILRDALPGPVAYRDWSTSL